MLATVYSRRAVVESALDAGIRLCRYPGPHLGRRDVALPLRGFARTTFSGSGRRQAVPVHYLREPRTVRRPAGRGRENGGRLPEVLGTDGGR
jgi:hypothetical protein